MRGVSAQQKYKTVLDKRTADMQITDFLRILALTPLERLEAMRRLDDNFMSQPWFVKTAAAAVVVLTGLFIWVAWNRQNNKSSRE